MITVRKAELGDARDIAAAEASYIDCPWTLKQIEDEISSSASVFLCACVDGVFAGYISGVCTADECELSNVAVKEECRRHGVAAALFERFIVEIRDRGVRSVFLLVREDNAPARALYTKLGFADVGNRKGYYKDKDAYIMRLNI